MAITVNAAFLNEVDRSLIGRYLRGFGRRPTFYQDVAQVETSASKQNIYPFLAGIGTLREWVGNRVVDDFALSDFAIKNRDFEKTMRVRKPDLEDDQLGMYGSIAEMLGDSANRHPDRLLRALIEGGFVTVGYDGVAFFATTHPTPSGGTQSNKGTTALSSTSYATAVQQMRALLDDGGEILDVFGSDLVLVVPPALEETARILLNQDFIVVAGVLTNNIWKGSARLMVINSLTDANNWYVFDMGNIIRPFIMQFRKRPVLTSLTNLTDENVFKRNEFLWGVDYRGAAGYALWQVAFGAAVA